MAEENESCNDENDEKNIGNAIFVCKRCGNIVVASEILWGLDNRNATSNCSGTTFATKTSRDITVYNGKSYSWKYMDFFQQNFDILEPYFPGPICNNCCKFLINKTRRQIEFNKFQIERMRSVVNKELFEDLKKKVEENEKEEEVLKEVISLTNSKTGGRLSRSGSELFEENSNQIINSKLSTSTVPQNWCETEKSPASSLLACTVFHISCSKHYGLINGIRLGYPDFDGVNADETMTGLIYVFQLVKFIASCLKINMDNINISTTIDISYYKDGEQKFINLDAQNMTKKKKIIEFNKAFEFLIDLLFSVFSFFENGQPNCPFRISKSKKLIGDVSYVASISEPYNWIYAMKHILTNLKVIQLQMLRKAVSSSK